MADLLAHGVNASSLGALGHPYPTKKLELFYGGKPMDLAREHAASDAVIAEIHRGEMEARNSEVGLLSWLWG